MAYEMQIRNSPGRAKIRSVWAVALLPIITLGIYHLVWWYKINRELRDYGDSKGYDLGQSPTNSLLALFPGGFIIIPPLVSYWRGTHRVQGAARLARTEPPNGWIALILYIILWPRVSGLSAVLPQPASGRRTRTRCPGTRRSAGTAGLDAASDRGGARAPDRAAGTGLNGARDPPPRRHAARRPGSWWRPPPRCSPCRRRASRARAGVCATCRCPPARVR